MMLDIEPIIRDKQSNSAWVMRGNESLRLKIGEYIENVFCGPDGEIKWGCLGDDIPCIEVYPDGNMDDIPLIVKFCDEGTKGFVFEVYWQGYEDDVDSKAALKIECLSLGESFVYAGPWYNFAPKAMPPLHFHIYDESGRAEDIYDYTKIVSNLGKDASQRRNSFVSMIFPFLNTAKLENGVNIDNNYTGHSGERLKEDLHELHQSLDKIGLIDLDDNFRELGYSNTHSHDPWLIDWSSLDVADEEIRAARRDSRLIYRVRQDEIVSANGEIIPKREYLYIPEAAHHSILREGLIINGDKRLADDNALVALYPASAFLPSSTNGRDFAIEDEGYIVVDVPLIKTGPAHIISKHIRLCDQHPSYLLRTEDERMHYIRTKPDKRIDFLKERLTCYLNNYDERGIENTWTNFLEYKLAEIHAAVQTTETGDIDDELLECIAKGCRIVSGCNIANIV